VHAVLRPRLPVDVVLSLAAARHGPWDPCVRLERGAVWRATRTPDGPATVRAGHRGDEIVVEAWGPGASWVTAHAPDACGLRDSLEGWDPRRHPLVAELDRRYRGLRIVATRSVLEQAVPLILEQKVTSDEAHRSWKRLVRALGEPAPGPGGLTLPPEAARLAATPYYAFHPLGVERRRADVIRGLASRARRVEEAASMPPADAARRLRAFPGVGAWTAAKAALVVWGDADAVPVGDFHLAKNVVYAFTGKRGGDDDAMLELLEPFRPHRGRAATLVKLSGIGPPRRGPRLAVRAYEKM
jgi:3-methyladenine DNA glycosylase/8-oxoguanine DNA glycosylase